MERPIQTGRRQETRGFTFIEMMVVVTVIVVLISMAIPMYNRAMIRSKESVLASNLFTLRTVIQHYSYDKARAPHSLQDLVSEGYLRSVPVDPMTGTNQTWQTVMEPPGSGVDQSNPGIFDVKSGSEKTSPLEGTNYSDW